MIKSIPLVTVMFVDIRGFTRITSEIGSVKMFEKIHAFYDAVEIAVGNHQGIVDNHMGDAVMIHFGAVKKHGKEVDQAISCALHIISLLKKDASFSVGIGIATGPVAYGLLHKPSDSSAIRTGRRTCIGHTVNIASRLTSIAMPGQVLLCENSKNLITTNYQLYPMPPLKVNGVNESLNVFDASVAKHLVKDDELVDTANLNSAQILYIQDSEPELQIV